MIEKQPDPIGPTAPEIKLTLDNVPVDGALGLLAYGDIGLVAWRRKRAEVDGLDWRQKLAEELQTEEELLKKVKEETSGARD